MVRLNRHILSYWRPELTREMFESQPVLEELRPPGRTIVRPGDVVWVCTRLRSSGHLLLLGRLLVGACLREGFRRIVTAAEDSAEPLKAISLMDVYTELRFSTKNYSDRLILRHGRINPEQFGSPRILTQGSAKLLSGVWYNGRIVDEFNIILEEDAHVPAEAAYADPVTNEEVENEAVSIVTRWYEERGWGVESVETDNCGYDLLCRRGRKEDHVEVKGTQGSVPSYFMTSNEYDCAQVDPLYVLCVVTGIFTLECYLNRYVGAQIFEEFDFTVKQYKAVPRGF